jgi:hypothetical protein
MFNAETVAKEIFNVLRSFDYEVDLYDDDGNKVAEPAEARRFFVTPNNMTVSIREDGENSSVKLFLSHSTETSEVEGLIETMRTLCTRFGVLFNVRKYDRELKPKDLSPHLDENKGEYSVDIINEAPRPEDPDKGEKVALRALMSGDPPEPIQVNAAAWEAFAADPPQLALSRQPEVIRRAQMGASSTPDDLRRIRLISLAPCVVDNTIHNLLSFVAAKFEEGDHSTLLRKIADQAVKAAYPADLVNECLNEAMDDEDDTDQQASDVVDAADQGNSDAIDTYERVTKDTSTFADQKNDQQNQNQNQNQNPTGNEQDGQKKSLSPMKKITPESWNDDGMLIKESFTEFAKWFDDLSSDKLFEQETPECDAMNIAEEDEDDLEESLTDDPHPIDYHRERGEDGRETAIDLAITEVTDEFNVDDFLNECGADFGYESLEDKNPTINGYDENIEYKDIDSSLHHYLEMQLDSTCGEELDASLSKPIVDQKIDEVIARVEEAGFKVVGREDETNDLSGDDNEILLDDDADEDVLASEDILQPTNKRNDFVRDVTVNKDSEYVNRLSRLAGITPQR